MAKAPIVRKVRQGASRHQAAADMSGSRSSMARGNPQKGTDGSESEFGTANSKFSLLPKAIMSAEVEKLTKKLKSNYLLLDEYIETTCLHREL